MVTRVGKEPRFGSRNSKDRDVLRESGDLEQHSTRHQKCPSAKLDRREQKNYSGEKYLSARSSKILHMSFRGNCQSSLFSNLLKASNCLSVYPFGINVFNTLFEKMLGSVRISPCF